MKVQDRHCNCGAPHRAWARFFSTANAGVITFTSWKQRYTAFPFVVLTLLLLPSLLDIYPSLNMHSIFGRHIPGEVAHIIRYLFKINSLACGAVVI